ncbi:MAG TPA: ABC transporter ATP-binding protein [Acidimicrobiia bacterium]|nr:ABC transporter ATP-binding protein [Acidimicrobiia bacterium]
MAEVVVTQGLTHDYGEVIALHNVDVSISSGITGLVGANGAGKTTLLRILLGLLHPTTGTVNVLGHDAITDPLAVRSRTGYMPENNCLPKDQTAADFVAYAAELAGLPVDEAKRRSSETLYLVGLEEERFRFIGDFSTGMAQRVKLAQAIVHGPEVVLLDEPASGLDPAGRDQMLELILRLGEFGINVIFSSHVLPDIEETCDWVVMLDGGRLVRSGPVAQLGGALALAIDIIGDPGTLVEALIGKGLTASLHHHTVNVEAIDESSYDVIRDSIAQLGFGLLRLVPVSRSLEDEFMVRADGIDR